MTAPQDAPPLFPASRLDLLEVPVAPADARVLVVVLAAGAAADVAARGRLGGAGGVLLVTTIAIGLLATGRVRNPRSIGLLAAAEVFAVWLGIRTSPWLLPLDLLAALGLIVLAASHASGGRMNLSIPSLVVRGVETVGRVAASPAFVATIRRARVIERGGDGENGRRIAILRGLLLAAPVVLVLGLLLASADAVFANVFEVSLDLASVGRHVVAVLAGAWLMAGFAALASRQPLPDLPPGPRWLGDVEATIVLGAVVALFSLFAAVQVVTAAGGAERVLRSAGLTYAEYARSGFFQLLGVAALTLPLLLTVRASAQPGGRRAPIVVLAETVVALTLVIVVVAVRRLDLYENAYGLTMLRLYSVVAAVVIGVAFVLLGLVIVGVGAPRSWYVPAVLTVGGIALLCLNVLNPEAFIVRHNLRSTAADVDAAYLADLSDDAVPALGAAVEELDADARDAALAELCRPRFDDASGWASFNLAREHAADVRAELCTGAFA